MEPLPPPLEALLRAANQGDAAAYATFLRIVAPMIRGIVRACGSELGTEECEDTVQETLLALHRKRHTWREDLAVRPWLAAIARHKVTDAFRARGRRVHLPVEDFADVLPAPAEPDPTRRLDVDRVIDRLDPRAARIVRAIGMEGASVAETADTLAMTETAVRGALHRAMKRLASLRRELIE
jgi:RNA polymerase sigma factor (sigma-70 family)